MAPSSSSGSDSSIRGAMPALNNEKTSGTSTSVDEKVVERIQAQKTDEVAQESKEGAQDGEDKKKKKAFFDKRTPLEIALEDPELAHLSPEYRKVVAEQIATIKRPPTGFRDLFRYTTKLELLLNGIGLLCAIAAGVAQPGMTILFGSLTTAFTNYGRMTMAGAADATPEAIADARDVLIREVNKNVLILVYIGVGIFVATWIYMYTWIIAGEKTTRRIRERYLAAIMRQNIAYFDRLGAGAVTTRIETDTHLIQEGISDKVSISVMYIATFIAGFVIAIIVNWRLALVCSTIIPCIAIAGGMMGAYVSKYKAAQLEATAKGATLAEEVISSVRIAHAFGNQRRLADAYDVANQETLDIGRKSAVASGVGMAVFFFVLYGSYGLAFYYGTTLILQGRADSGEVITVLFSLLIGAFSLAELAPLLEAISFARGAATEIYATIDRVPIIDSASDKGRKLEHVEGLIELEGIEFIYPSRPGAQVLYNFNGVFPPGKMTALVGGSGSGKSTIIGLLERDPVAGTVKLDGVPLKELNVKWLRNQIGLVSQEPTLFKASVAGNIEHGLIGSRFEHESPEERRRRVVDAAKLANADGFIQALPQGYDTEIGERGMLLSGGQKQRIAIARAIISDPKILLLDEATSALDTNSEAIVQDALDRASAGRTTIAIAHRLSTIRDADQIIVLTAGHILESAMTTEEGTAHTRLLRNPDGAYSKLVAAQRIREEVDADLEAEHAPVPGELTREQIEEMARTEKPQFEQLKRAGTGRSLASEMLERRKNDIEAAGGDEPIYYGVATLFKRMYALNRESWRRYFFAFIAAIASGCVYPCFGIVFGGMVSAFQYDPDTQGDLLRRAGDRHALWSFIMALLATLAIAVEVWLFTDTAERLSAKIRLNTFTLTLRQDIAFFDEDKNSTGTLTNAINDRATKIFGLFGQTQGVIVQNVFTLVSGAIVGLCFSWKIALVGIACIPLTLSAGILRLRVVVLKDEQNKKSHGASAQVACEAASAIRTVAALTREEDCLRLYSEELDAPMRESNRVAIWSNAFYSLAQALAFFVIALIFWFGAHQMINSGLSVEGFFVAMIAIVFASIEAGHVFAYVPDASSFFGAARSFLELEDSQPEIDAEDTTSGKDFDLATAQGHIRFENVHFRYPTRPYVPVLRGLDVEIKPGQFAAFVGASGCGKSTSIQLITRFYDPLGGKVLVDGQDISTLNVQSYRRGLALVSQEPTLYAGTVRYNVALGAYIPAEQVTQEQIEQACKDANIHDLIMGLPDGYDTDVGGKGTMLSGGQKQRIAIARALIRNPKILLLDEATSALDSESERVVQRALDQAAKNRTTIAIAHRLSTIQNADVIFVLKDGRVAEKGTHSQLLAQKGIYFELVEQQTLAKN
ncbi:hypothetical protein JCM10450v2_004002 [Rhodotorula kratochvilovae]